MIVAKETKYVIRDNTQKITIKYICKRIINRCRYYYYKVLLNIVRPQYKGDRKYKSSVCAVFRNEASYLQEWVEFHKLAGIEHFYLYNNFSEDNYLEVLKPYIDSGLVELKDWPYERQQMGAFDDCVLEHSNETQWIGFIDLDEFVIPNKYKDINELLDTFKHRPIVIINWKCIGSSGRLERNLDGLVTEDFTIGWYKYSDIGKIFFNTDYDFMCGSAQFMHQRWTKCNGIKLPPVNIFGKPVIGHINPIRTDDMPAQINHYLLKSVEEYVSRKSKRGGGVHEIQYGFHDQEYFRYHEQYCQAEDKHAYRYLSMLKKSIKESGRRN